MNTLILGSSGKIGKYFLFKKNKNFLYTYNSLKINQGIKFDILKDNIEPILKKNNISKIVLMAAISDPDQCFKQKKFSYRINVLNTIKVIDKCIKKKIYIIFLSSEFVYNGVKGNFNEKDETKPVNLYGKQKKIIENYLKKKYKNYCVMRIGKTYSDDLNDGTIISKFLNDIVKKQKFFYGAEDQIFNPLYVKDLIKIIIFYLKNNIVGTYNVGGPQSFSRFKLLNIFLKSAKKIITKNYSPIIIKTKLSSIKLLEKRPLNVSMNVNKLRKTINFKLCSIKEIQKKIITINNAHKIKRR